MSDLEPKNLFASAKIVSVDTDHTVYMKQQFERGNPNYVMTRSDLCEFAKCPIAWRLGKRSEDTDATDWGSLIDCLVLDAKRANERIAVIPDTYKKSGMKCPNCGSITDSQKCAKCKVDRVQCEYDQEWSGQSETCREWAKEQQLANRMIVKKDELTEAKLAVSRLALDDEIPRFLNASDFQVYVTAVYEDEETGVIVPIKRMIDIVPRLKSEWANSLSDFKTARNAALFDWEWTVYKRGYHTQGAMDLDAYNAATGELRMDYRHVISENVFPYITARRILSDDFIIMGREFAREQLRRYARCIKENAWPDYDTDAIRQFKGWAFTSPDAKMVKSQIMPMPFAKPQPSAQTEQENFDVLP